MSYNNDISRVDRSLPIRSHPQNSDDDNRRAENARGRKKDFKKVLDKTDEEDNGRKAVDQNGEVIEDTDGEGQRKRNLSLFELNAPRKPISAAQSEQAVAANVPVKKDGKSQVETAYGPFMSSRAEKKESPSSLFSKVSKASAKKEESDETAIAGEGRVSNEEGDDSSTDADAGGSGGAGFKGEQNSVSYVNPLAASANATETLNVSADKAQIKRMDMQEIINQLVDKVYQMDQKGQTDTVVVLKQPPMFEGATITVTSFDSAKGEFNIAFQNLNQTAQRLLSMHVNQNSLIHALEQKGYAVHIVSATTLAGTIPLEGTKKPEDRQRQNDEQPKEKQQRQNRNQG